MGKYVKIAWKRPWPSDDIMGDGFLLSTAIKPCDADGLLCEWQPTEDLLKFPGISAWYCCEPKICGMYWTEPSKSIIARLTMEQKLNHKHPDPFCRVPHVTHVGEITQRRNLGRIPRACAIVSNVGEQFQSEDLMLRKEFCLRREVDLFGRKDGWRIHKFLPWSHPRLPSNYKGEISGNHWAESKIDLMSKYKVAVCMENCQEEFYFTEKFVAAVQAGCIPVYQAHSSVRNTFLSGAKWVDPADHGFDPKRTLAAALAQSSEEFMNLNLEWLRCTSFKFTERTAVMNKLGKIIRDRITRK